MHILIGLAVWLVLAFLGALGLGHILHKHGKSDRGPYY
jgi:hypothetical protein